MCFCMGKKRERGSEASSFRLLRTVTFTSRLFPAPGAQKAVHCFGSMDEMPCASSSMASEEATVPRTALSKLILVLKNEYNTSMETRSSLIAQVIAYQQRGRRRNREVEPGELQRLTHGLTGSRRRRRWTSYKLWFNCANLRQ